MTIFILLWPYLLTTKLRSVIRHSLGHSTLHGYVIGRVRFYKKAKNVSTSLVERIGKKMNIVMKVWDMIYNNLIISLSICLKTFGPNFTPSTSTIGKVQVSLCLTVSKFMFSVFYLHWRPICLGWQAILLSKMTPGEVGVWLSWWCHALVHTAPGNWGVFLNLIIFL